jgi:ABC-2 type transport system permease protein
MLSTLIRHELRAYWRDGRFRTAAALVGVLLFAAVLSGWSHQSRLAAEKSAAHAAEQARWLGQGEKNPHSAAHYGLYAFKPASPLTAFDPGIEPYVGVSIWLEAHYQNEFVHRPAQDASALSRFGELTAALVLQILLPLLIVLLGHGAFATERERGTLRSLLAAGVVPRTLALGKLLGTAAALALLLAPAVAVAALAIAWHGPAAGLPSPLFRFGLNVAVYLAYLAVFLAVTLAISARAATARTALLTLLAFWILACLVLPRVAADFAAARHPTPSAAAFRAALDAEMGGAHSSDRAIAVRARVLQQYGVTRTEDLPIDWRGISLQEGEEQNYPIFDRHFGALFDTFRAQVRTQQFGALLTPLLAVQPLSLALSGTDFEHHRAFTVAAEKQRRVMQEILNGDVTLHDREGTDYKAGPAMWARIPPFAYTPPTLASLIPHYAPALALLAAWLLAAAWLALRSATALKP